MVHVLCMVRTTCTERASFSFVIMSGILCVCVRSQLFSDGLIGTSQSGKRERALLCGRFYRESTSRGHFCCVTATVESIDVHKSLDYYLLEEEGGKKR